jgi:hypothetical protein
MAKIYHRAKHIRDDGKVSALCYKTPRPIDLGRESWVLEDDRVTCSRCLRAIAAAAVPGEPPAKGTP